MDAKIAATLISECKKLFYVRHMGGPYFLCNYTPSAMLDGRLLDVPSFVAVDLSPEKWAS